MKNKKYTKVNYIIDTVTPFTPVIIVTILLTLLTVKDVLRLIYGE